MKPNREEPTEFFVYLIDKDERRWYSPRLTEAYSGLEATEIRCKEFLKEESDKWSRAEIIKMEPKLVCTVLGAPYVNL